MTEIVCAWQEQDLLSQVDAADREKMDTFWSRYKTPRVDGFVPPNPGANPDAMGSRGDGAIVPVEKGGGDASSSASGSESDSESESGGSRAHATGGHLVMPSESDPGAPRLNPINVKSKNFIDIEFELPIK